jgi:OmpA-OmpF porin, OOP family
VTKRIAIGLAAYAMIITTHAEAAGESAAYVGVSGGLAQTGIDDTGFNEKDMAYKVFGGYSFSDLIAFEGAYFNGGKPSLDAAGIASASVSLSGFNASVLLRARTASSFAVFAKVGYAMYDYKVTAQLLGIAVDAQESDKGVSYGLGVTYTIARKYLVRAEFEGVNIKGGNVPDSSFYMVTIGAGYRF